MSKPNAESDSEAKPLPTLEEGCDYYLEDGLMVFTGAYLLKRGYCCESGCRHCPYGYVKDVNEGASTWNPMTDEK